MNPAAQTLILHHDGKTLEYCGTYEPVHPAQFKTSNTQLHLIWQPAPEDFVIPKVPEAVPVPIPPVPR
jgi:hypothetical protein